MLALLLSLVQVSGAPDAAVAPQPPRFAQFVTQTDGLLEPTAAAWHPSGSLVVVESFASRLAFVRADGTLERRVDLRDEAGEWVWPHGVECLPDGSVLLVGINAVAMKADPALSSLKLVKLPAAETLVDVLPYNGKLIAVGRRGVQNLGALP